MADKRDKIKCKLEEENCSGGEDREQTDSKRRFKPKNGSVIPVPRKLVKEMIAQRVIDSLTSKNNHHNSN
ncbi:hypothetical protein LOK49_Contig129G00006 [Camellia lanceoleosa]|nr:hypothetical protein LOK49_Contig129G00006 [Camellia lanceoleosa]